MNTTFLLFALAVAPKGNAMHIEPFTIEVSEADLNDLHHRLDATRWAAAAPVPGWSRGVPLEVMKDWAKAWRTFYWRKHEKTLNAFPQFVTTIDGQRIHFIHVKSKKKGAKPLLLLHGWPGSVAEFMKVIEPLSADFDVIVPSLPGFGFSGPTKEGGWNVERISAAMLTLMQGLGYERFFIHGNDTGAMTARAMAVAAPKRVLAMHVTQVFDFTPPEGEPKDDFEKRSRETAARYERELSAYMYVQSQAPQTLAYGLVDSPVAQLAWLLDLFQGWTDTDGSLIDAISRDDVLINASLYWFTATGGSSAQVYAEPGEWGEPKFNSVPTGIAVFPKDGFLTVRRIAEKSNNVVHYKQFKKGGHFAALEQPNVLVEDLREFFKKR